MDANLPEQFVRDDILTALGEPLTSVLDMSTWRDGAALGTLYESLRRVVAESVLREEKLRKPIRDLALNRLGSNMDRYAPAAAGLYRVSVDELAELHAGLLFSGAVECCDGTIAAHDSLLLSVIQIGVSLAAYQGHQGTWTQRFYRRDLHTHYPDPLQEAEALLQKRGRPDGNETLGQPASRLFGRALMEYAERAALLELSDKPWRIGHGNPVAVNMLMPTTPDLLQAGLSVLRRLILDHRRFLFVASEPADRLLLTLGNALLPLEFAVVDTLITQFPDSRLERLADTQRGHKAEVNLIQSFLKEIRTEVVTGVYRAAEHAPARVFYAHKDFACDAAALAIADSVLQPHRGFPMLIDLADLICRNTFDGGSFGASIQDAYAAAGEPLRYMGERETRS